MTTPNNVANTPRDSAKRVDSLGSFVGNPNFVLSLARGLKVIEAFDSHTEGLSIAEVSRRTGFSRAATRRLLLTLEMLEYVEENGRIFRLRMPILRLGFSYLSSASLPSVAQPILEHLTEVLHESTSLSVLDGDEIVYLARSPTKRVMSIGLSVGSRLPSYCTSMGRVMLAALPAEELHGYLDHLIVKPLTPKTIIDKTLLADVIGQVRSDGYALIDEELELGLRSIAVPVSNSQGKVIAAINVGAHAARASTAELIHRVLPVLRKAAITLREAIGSRHV